MTPAEQEAIALRSLRQAQAHGWHEHLMRDYAAQCLVAVGLERRGADAVIERVWQRHFAITRAI